jgi:hypothetical protein
LDETLRHPIVVGDERTNGAWFHEEATQRQYWERISHV